MDNKKILILVMTCIFMTSSFSSIPMLASSSIQTFDKEVDFTFNKNISKSFSSKTFSSPNNVSKFLDQINDFNPENVTQVTGYSTTNYYYNITILNLTVNQINEPFGGGAGEEYLFISANNNKTQLDNNGAYYSMNNGDTITLNYNIFLGWLNNISLSIEVRNSNGLNTYSNSGKVTIDNLVANSTSKYITDTSEASMYISITTNASKSVDFSLNDLANIHQPYLYIDVNDYADSPQISYFRIYKGTDSELGLNTYVFQYFYYWPKELDNNGNSLGHYYDFAPIFLYTKSLLGQPERIAIQENNPGLTALPARLSIYSSTYSTGSTLTTVINATDQLAPILGQNTTIKLDEHPISDFYNSGVYLQNNLTYPNLVIPNVTITDSYHNLEINSIPGGSTNFGFMNQEQFNYSSIYHYYSLLSEAFLAPIKSYSWNNYEVPENLSLTLDVKYNPMVFPYMTDFFEVVTHQNQLARQSTSNQIAAAIDLNSTLILPTKLSLTYPDTLATDSDSSLSLSAQSAGDPTIIFDYSIKINTSLNWWFLRKNITLSYNGEFKVNINTQGISLIQKALGIDKLKDAVNINQFFTINSITVNPKIIGTVFESSLSVHLLEILKYATTSILPAAEPIFNFIEKFIGTVDLNVDSSLKGVVLGNIAVSDTGLASINSESFYFDQENTPKTITLSPLTKTSSTKVTLDFSNINYGLNYTSSWDLVFTPSNISKYVLSDISFHLATIPNYLWTKSNTTDNQLPGQNFSSPELTIGEVTSSSNADYPSIAVTLVSLTVLSLIARDRRKKS